MALGVVNFTNMCMLLFTDKSSCDGKGQLFKNKEHRVRFEHSIHIAIHTVCRKSIIVNEKYSLQGLLGITVDKQMEHGIVIDYEWITEDGDGEDQGLY